MTDEWQDHARRELEPKLASSAFMMAIDPAGAIDPKIALEVGYAILLDKPIVVLVPPGSRPTPGLGRIATAALDTVAGQLQLQAGLAEAAELIRTRE